MLAPWYFAAFRLQMMGRPRDAGALPGKHYLRYIFSRFTGHAGRGYQAFRVALLLGGWPCTKSHFEPALRQKSGHRKGPGRFFVPALYAILVPKERDAGTPP